MLVTLINIRLEKSGIDERSLPATVDFIRNNMMASDNPDWNQNPPVWGENPD